VSAQPASEEKYKQTLQRKENYTSFIKNIEQGIMNDEEKNDKARMPSEILPSLFLVRYSFPPPCSQSLLNCCCRYKTFLYLD
jgi:hypothetical protein